MCGEQVTSLGKGVHNAPPGLRAILRWGNLRHLRNIIGGGLFVTQMYALYGAYTFQQAEHPRRDSNSQQPDPKSGALSIELRGLKQKHTYKQGA